MANNLEVALKIKALAEGLENIAAMTRELESLADQGERPIADNTAELRAGARDAAGALTEAASAADNLEQEAAQPVPDATGPLRDGARDATGALNEAARATNEVAQGAAQAAPSLQEMVKSLRNAAIAGVGLTALAASLKGMAEEAMNYDTRGRKLEQVVRATGGAAGYTADEIRAMSSELALATLGSIQGFEDAAAALLTFRQVSGSAFGRALELSQDLASVMGGDTKSAAIQLGKALEDPAQGLTALTRSGVSFSEAEKEIIKGLMEAGRVAEAHGQILDKVAQQVGGVAKAMAGGLAGAIDTAGQRWEELKIAAGDAMQPGLIDVANQISGALEFLAANLNTIIVAAKAAGMAAVAAFSVKVLASVQAYAASIATATAATAALTRATTALAAAGATVYKALPVAVFAGIAIAVAELSGGMDELRKDAERLAEAEENLAITQDRLKQKYAEISDATGVQVKNQAELKAAVDSGRIAWDAAINTYVRVPDAFERMAASTPTAALAEVREELELLAKRGPETAAALDRIMQSVDLSSSDGIRALATDLDYLKSAALATGEQIEASLVKRLSSMTNRELREFRMQAEMAFGGSADAAERLAQINDAVLSASFAKLGVNAAAALGKISPAAQEAIDSVDGIVAALDAAQVGAEQSATAIEMALGKAFDVADSLPALDEINARVKALGESGKIGAEGMSRLAEAASDARKRLEDATPGIQSVEEAFRQLGITSATELQKAATEARQAFDVIKNSGTASAQDIERAFQAYADAAVAANGGVVDASVQAQAAQLGLKVEADDAGKVIMRSMKEAAEAIREVEKGSKDAAEAAEDMADAAEDVAGGLNKAADASSSAATASRGVSTAWVDAARAGSQYADEAGRYAQATYEAQMAMIRGEQTVWSYTRALSAAMDAGKNAAAGYIGAMENLDRQQAALNNSALDGYRDMELQLLRLTGTREQIAAAEKARDEAAIQRQIALAKIEAQRASMRGEGDEARRLQEEIKLYEKQLVLLDKIYREQEKQAKAAEKEAKRREQEAEREAKRREREQRERERDTERERSSPSNGGGGGGTDQGGRPGPQSPGGTTTLNINLPPAGPMGYERGALEQFARQLGPVITDLQRKGAL